MHQEGTTPNRRRATNADGEGVSLKPSDWRRAAALDLANLRTYKPTGDPDNDRHRMHPTIPRFVNRALLNLAAMIGDKGPNRSAVWTLKSGVVRLEHDVPEVGIIQSAYDEVMQAGAEHSIVQLETWSYAIAPIYGTNVKLDLYAVPPRVKTDVKNLAQRLGLTQSTMVAVAMMTVLVEVEFAGDLPEVLMSQLGQFHQAVQQRASLAAELARQATAISPLPAHRGSWGQIIGGDE